MGRCQPVPLTAGNSRGKEFRGKGHPFGIKSDIVRESSENVLVIVF